MTTAKLQGMGEAPTLSVAGDAAAFAQIVRDHQSLVFSLAYHFLHDGGRAEEIAQEVFFRLYQNLQCIKSRAHLVFWLRKVTWRCCIDETRRERIWAPLGVEQIVEPTARCGDPDPLLDRRVRQIVASLPAKARGMVILRYQEELDLAEIAEILDVPINTVKSGLKRALAVLRTKLARNLGESKT